MHILKSFANKKIGYVQFDAAIAFDSVSLPCHKSKDCYIILFAQSGNTITSDFVEYKVEKDTLFFLNIGQQFQLQNNSEAELVYFNPEFYCIAFHDKELSCDGVLFNNVFETPYIILAEDEKVSFRRIIDELKEQLNKEDYWTEEMTRTKLKELIITASRAWLNRTPDPKKPVAAQDEISRKFSLLVEANYHKLHSVAQYAELLHTSAKTLSRKIVLEREASAHTIIKNRIILQAKRLLSNTDLTVKEISAQLGYDDHSYFVRFFKIQTGKSPIEYRKIVT